MHWRHLCSVAVMSAFFLSPASGRASAEAPRQYDVVVYGATASGSIAAIAAAGEGVEVALLEPGRHVGGAVSGGLGRTDHGNKDVIGGLTLEFFERVGKHYGKDIEWFLEPHVAEDTFRYWLREAGVDVFFEHRVETAQKMGTRITGLEMENGSVFQAAVFIDASYEGDLLPRAGISYRVGREGRAEFDEWFGGRLEISSFPVQFPPIPARKSGELIPLVYGGDPGKPGEADDKSQTYNFRLCLSDQKENQVPFPRPPDYDPDTYELLRRDLAIRGKDFNLRNLMIMSPLPNHKVDVNHGASLSTCHIGANWDYPEADYPTRQKIWDAHKHYTQGFLYFLAHDPTVPKHIQEEINRWGLARDEFADTDHWPHQLYVREARRMVGQYFMIQADLETSRTKFDSIGMGSYNLDSHHVQRIESPAGTVLNEGNTNFPIRPYQIPYRAILPQREECGNVLSTVCMSASHAAYSSIRMEPQYMILGQAAGVAAAMAAKGRHAVHEVDIGLLQARLLEQKQILSYPDPPPIRSVGGHRILGYVADNSGADVTGPWQTSTDASPFILDDYIHFIGEDYLVAEPGQATVRLVPELPFSGEYDVRVSYTPHPNRASDVRVTVNTVTGPVTVLVDQRKTTRHLLPFVSVGVYELSRENAYVEISGGTDGRTVADAVQFLSTF